MLRHLISFFAFLLLLTLAQPAEAGHFLKGDAFDFSAFGTAPADESEALEDPIKIALLAEEKTIQPGTSFWLAIKVDLQKNWHTYWKNAGDTGMPTTVEWHLPTDYEVEAIEWPAPERFVDKSLVSFGYATPFVLLAKIHSAKDAPVGNVKIGATMRWVACNEGNCLPGESMATVTLPVANSVPAKDTQTASVFSAGRQQLPLNDWSVESDAGHKIIRLAVEPPAGHARPYALAYFLPSDLDVINYHPSLQVVQAPGGKGYFLNLHRHNTVKNLPSELNGILLLHPEEGTKGSPVAIEIHTPLKEAIVADASSSGTTSELSPSSATDFEGGLGLALVMAFVGGMILNLMPCVLPVISLKVLSIVKMAGNSRLANFQHGVVFAVGVLASFWILAGVLLLLQAYGHAVGWGFQLQEPIFVAILAAVLLVFALSLFGVFELGTGLASWAGQTETDARQHSGSFTGSFFNGVLATAVATPCTGPFLGSAIGFAVTLPPLAAMAVFTSLGLGMAFPYLILTSFPSLVKWLPRPGEWMITFKQLMGFLLIATDLWLIWVFGAQTDNLGVFLLLCSLFILAMACWAYGRWCSPVVSQKVRRIGYFASGFLVLIGTYFLVISAELVPDNNEKALASHLVTGEEDPRAWLPFSPNLVEQFREQGKPVFIDFTAKWCVICQTNHMVLLLDDLEKKFEDLGIVKIKADWTRPDPAITQELRKFGRNGVPLYLLYAPGASTPLILPQVLTPDVVNSYLEKIQPAVEAARAKETKQSHSVANP